MAIAKLSDLRVLVTRPEDRSADFAAALRAAGAEVVLQPLLNIAPLTAAEHGAAMQKSHSILLNLDEYQRLIFISVNAVQFGVEQIEQYWPQWPVGIEVYAIGAATAAALADRDVTVHQRALAMNSESLLSCSGLQNVAKSKILIVRGVGGREYLAEELKKRGALVDYVECYQRCKPSIDGEQLREVVSARRVNMVALNSGETLSYFTELMGEEAFSYPILVPGARVEELARAQGYCSIVQAENAGTEASITALECYANNNTPI
ncbi:Uroporphyrinogen-III synthase [Zhongshania aliphaticivorans]|uniref:Uroporphyrinogen-III synthase n=1 Tax=Zhongshania aliphaticivorans TaxID=1470434 RepID=A0A5S9QAM6_9GAMM|nr:uroporphyrinogen-III synthase [Zhongshania aliphaticivorans]CAA0102374.1 Uroporphyrinogen-III synthase [Zhongshania aliphaticivorans]CAA0114355.1 Uroporphyrinogen-III synthase [Zhongshania aliphaticivorans]